MTYAGPLPSTSSIERLGKLVPEFPAAMRDLLRISENERSGADLLSFLQLFPKDELFLSLDDFLSRSYRLRLFIQEERDMPPEKTRSPQD
jgi:hypothetical protein